MSDLIEAVLAIIPAEVASVIADQIGAVVNTRSGPCRVLQVYSVDDEDEFPDPE